MGNERAEECRREGELRGYIMWDKRRTEGEGCELGVVE